MSDLTQICDQCGAEIPEGEKYGMIVFNIETLEPSETEEAEGEVTVHASEPMEILCMKCSSEYVKALELEDV